MTIDLDIEQVLELMLNGFTKDHACAAVAESHGYERDGVYFIELTKHPNINRRYWDEFKP